MHDKAAIYMLQWQIGRYVSNIKISLSNKILQIEPDQAYDEFRLQNSLWRKNCEPLTENMMKP